MKTIGKTVDGKNYIVEMTLEEHLSFEKIERAMMGASYIEFSLGRSMEGTDLSAVFKALDDLFSAKVSINQLKEFINNLDRVLGGSK